MRCACLAALLLGAACSQDDGAAPPVRASYVDQDITRLWNLGPLGAQGHPAGADIELTDHDDEPVHPGGIVLRNLEGDSPLGAAGLAAGDVIVRVGETWLPNKEDPALDLIDAVEAELSAGRQEIDVHYVRRRRVRTASVRLDLPPLEDGLPQAVTRFTRNARRALDHLKAIQQADGSFATAEATPDARVAVAAVAGLAFLGAGGDAYDEPIERCLGLVRDAEAGPWGTAFSLMFLSELLARRGMDIELMKAVAQCNGRLLKAQGEDGGWSAGGDEAAQEYSVFTLAANQALLALGMAERAGVQGKNDVVERACAFVKKHSNDGHIVSPTAAGFDRRNEAGRCAGAAAALRSLNCVDYDAFLRRLQDYHEQRSVDLPNTPTGAELHLLHAAVLARQRGGHVWDGFVREFRCLLVALQKPDGSFAELPNAGSRPLAFERACAGDAWRTAVGALVLLLQEDHTPVLIAARPSPKARDGDGKLTDPGAGAAKKKPPKGRVMTFDSPEEARKYLEKLKKKDDG